MDAPATAQRPIRSSLGVAVLGVAGWLLAFVQVLILFAALEAERHPALGGVDAALGIPVAFPSLGLFAFIAAVGVTRLGGTGFARWFSIVSVVVIAAGAVYLGWAMIAGFSGLSLLQFLFAIGALALAISWLRAPAAPAVPVATRRWILGGFLVLVGALGFLAAISLAVDKVLAIIAPGTALSCDFSLVVQCGANLSSPQGSAFGFPNPLIGLGGFLAPFVVGLAVLSGARLSRWLWLTFNLGLAGALAFVIWLMSQSIFVLGTLCPWCMLVWAVTIPAFWLVTFRSFADGYLGSAPRRVAEALYSFTPFITIASYIVVAIVAQVRLDVISYL